MNKYATSINMFLTLATIEVNLQFLVRMKKKLCNDGIEMMFNPSDGFLYQLEG